MVSVKVTSGWLCALLVLGVALFASSLAMAGPYFNSSESGCDGSDPNVLMCDDFEDGVYYNADCNDPGGDDPINDGWGGWIYAPIDTPNMAFCGGMGAAGTNCTATYAAVGGSQSGSAGMADHALAGPGTIEVYIRVYYKVPVGFQTADQKFLSVNKVGNAPCGSGIDFVNSVLQSNLRPRFQAGGLVLQQNLGNAQGLVPGNWMYFELRVKLDTPGGAGNGLIEMWMNDCGPAGFCTGTPTKRLSYTGINIRAEHPADLIGALWFEGWTQAGGYTGRRFMDQIKVSKVGPIGFMGAPTAGPPPASPTGLTIQ